MAKRGKKAKEYILYKKDDFIEQGYIKDIATKTGINIAYLYSMTGKDSKGPYTLDVIEED